LRKRRVALFLLFLVGLLVLVGTSIDQSIVYPSPDPVSTYYEYTTVIINGTALNSTDNLDADDEVYYAVDSDAGGGIYEVNVEHMSGQVNESIVHITQIFFEDNFKFNETVTAYLEWFNWTANAWVNINNGIVGPTEVAWNKTWTSRFSDAINSTGYMKARIHTLNQSNTHRLLEDYLHWDVTYVVPDTAPPEWSNAGTNNTAAGQPTLFHVKWTDDIGLSGFIFGTNNTGAWTNDTWTPMSGTTDWSNVTKILNSTGGLVVQWRAWANDTSDNWNDAGILSLTTTQPPVASFIYSPSTPYTGENVTFNATDSYDPDGTIASYLWDFGDGTNASGVIVTHSYADNGTYTVTQTVTDNDGLSDTTSANVTVFNRLPVAIFTESAETVSTGETITFNASASYDPDGSIVSYFWDFGDGTNATGVIVGHAYADNGTYTVTLTVTDNDGATATANATKTVLNRPPVASFTESATIVYTGEVIYFNASASYDPDGSIVSYRWDFGDGNTTVMTTPIITHAYADNGTYTVTLTVTDDDGETASTNATKTVLNRPPVAIFTESATTVYTGEPINFNASSSYDPDGTIVSYWWNFGDGTNATGITTTHSYANDGNYTVTLTVTDDDGATNSSTSTKTVLNRSPVASFTESATTVYTNETITFNASASYDPDGFIVSYSWNFGDGTNATGVAVNHAYSDNGTYTVTLTVIDDNGATSTAASIKTVLNRPPVALFTESAETVYTGVVISFDASDSHDSDGTIVSYLWDFGDGTNATGVTVGHGYADDGTYTVTLTVTDDDGATAIAIATKTILNRSPTASFTSSATMVYTGVVIHFDASGSSDPDGIIVSYFWDFGDGTNVTGVTVDHAYTNDGTYVVTLTVTDDDGATGITTQTMKVLNRSPAASFTESPETVYTNETITFDASGSYDLDGYIANYFWDFGDGANATGVVVNHAYVNNGTYTVILIVTDDDGATDTVTSTITVLNRPPVANFTESAETVVVGEVIYFNASSSYDPDGFIVSYFWDFGDGTNATGVTTEHAYADNGVYTVTLTVTDDDGATASTNATKTVGITPPVAIFSESAEIVYTSESIYFNASGSYDPDGNITSYFWDFGDGSNATGVVVDHAYADDGNYTVTLTVTDDDGAADTAT
jgi:PKD repeat protein